MDTNILSYKHGKYIFSISLKHIESKEVKEDIKNALLLQFSSFLPCNKTEEPELVFYFCENIENLFNYDSYTNIKKVKYANDTLFYKQNGINFICKKNDKTVEVFFEISLQSSFKENCRFLNKNFSNAIEKQISLFYYRVFLIFSQILNVLNDSTYIHGASIANEKGEATLFCADSGVGKSSMLFRMAKEGKYQYLADDLSIIAPDGNCYYSGRAISTKPYHLKNFPFLNELIEKEMHPLQKLQWKFLRDNRLTYGINPQKLFSKRYMEKSNIKRVIHLVNTNEENFSIETAHSETLAKASANILMNELILGNEIIYKALSIPGNSLFPSPGEMYSTILKKFERVFNSADRYILKVPYMSHPEKMYDFLLKSNLLN